MMWCSWYRWKINQAIDAPGGKGGRPVIGHSTARHVEKCVHCREYLHRMAMVAERLALDAGEWRTVLASDEKGFESPAEGGPVLFRLNWSLAAAAVLVMGMSLGVYMVSNTMTREAPRLAQAPDEPGEANVAVQAPDVGQLWTTSTVVVSGLLNNQAELLAMDTRRAAEFLLNQVPMSDRLLPQESTATQ